MPNISQFPLSSTDSLLVLLIGEWALCRALESHHNRVYHASVGSVVFVAIPFQYRKGALRRLSLLRAPPLLMMLVEKTAWKRPYYIARDWGNDYPSIAGIELNG